MDGIDFRLRDLTNLMVAEAIWQVFGHRQVVWNSLEKNWTGDLLDAEARLDLDGSVSYFEHYIKHDYGPGDISKSSGAMRLLWKREPDDKFRIGELNRILHAKPAQPHPPGHENYLGYDDSVAAVNDLNAHPAEVRRMLVVPASIILALLVLALFSIL